MTWVFWLYAPGALFWGGCALLYGLHSPWRRSWTGRAMFTTCTSLAVVLSLAALFRVVHLSHPLAVALSVAALAAVDLAGAIWLVNIVRLQRRDREENR